MNNTQDPVLLLDLAILLGLAHDSTGLEVDLVEGDHKPPVPRIDLPSQVQGDDDRRSEVLLEEVLGIGSGIRRRL